jgi:hypothetical protein
MAVKKELKQMSPAQEHLVSCTHELQSAQAAFEKAQMRLQVAEADHAQAWILHRKEHETMLQVCKVPPSGIR